MITHSISPNEIKIGSRFRDANQKKVEEIAQSILTYGQFHPVMIDRDNNLIAGLHRVEACRINGQTVECVYRDEADELFLREMELEENIRRAEMTWQDRARAVARLHEIRVQRDPNWSQPQTAAMVEENQRQISESIKVAKMMELFPEIEQAKNFRHAVNMANAKAKQVLRHEEVKNNATDYSDIEQRILLGDSTQLIKTVPDESFHLVLTDPPFGIEYDRRTSGTLGNLTSYEDSEESYLRLLSMAPELYRVLKKDAWLVWFLGISWYERAKTVFREAGFTVDEIPIIWNRSDGKCFTSRPDRYFARGYDIALHCLKGEPQLVERGKPNVLTIPPVGQGERELQVERPVELYQELIRRMTIPKQVVADFFVGSGSCPAAAASLGRDYFGIELDPTRRAAAIKKVKAHIRPVQVVA